ncbi:MAG: class I SAM-dependent methyltransferase [Thermoleophilaceae bacterium]
MLAGGTWGMRLWRIHARRRSRAFEQRPQRKVHHELVAELAPGKSFVDIGGIWGIHGDIAFRAERAGATRAVVVDGMDPVEEFQTEHRERGSSVEYVQGDLHDPVIVDQLGAFDVVWCSGVIYHSPNPYLQIEHLRRLCSERLMVSSRVIPELPGFEGACLWYPGVSSAAQRELTKLHEGFGAQGLLGPCAPLDETPGMGYANTWWGITVSALTRMLAAARFEVERVIRYGPVMVDILARPVDRESMIPPPGFSRERGQRRRDQWEGERPAWLGD